jgi:methionine sulfoxide reductase catalytic subunit
MANIIIPKAWQISELNATPEKTYFNRRKILKTLGLGGLALAGGAFGGTLAGCDGSGANSADGGGLANDRGSADSTTWSQVHQDLYPADRNDSYTVDERPLSPEEKATKYNNFYEFSVLKPLVWEKVGDFQTYPWTVEISGLVKSPKVWDLDALIRSFTLEERVYRFRCVEAWAMTVPWTGFPLKKLIDLVEPLSSAKYIRLISKADTATMPGLAADWYPWPYFEGLRLDEANNEMAFLATGIYGKTMPKQNGAPIRLVTPWKYGYKSAKSIVKIEFLAEEPETFWHKLVPHEYSFLSNVDPEVPHPRWSQATERLIGDGSTVPTQKYNGYADQVGSLYTG